MTATPNARLVRSLLWIVPAAILLAGLLIYANSATGTSGVGSDPGRPAQGGVLGSGTATVTIEVFSDFQCPHCRDFALNVEPQLVKDYVDGGKAKLVYRHFIIFPGSEVAGQAAECAGKQNKFWPYHDKLFAVQGGQAAVSRENLKKYAGELGLIQAAFDACLDSGEMEPKVRNDSMEGANRGVQSTPTTFVNGQMLVGTQPYDAYKRTIDAALAR